MPKDPAVVPSSPRLLVPLDTPGIADPKPPPIPVAIRPQIAQRLRKLAGRWRDPTWTDGRSAEDVLEQRTQADRIDALASKIFSGVEDLNAEAKAEIIVLVKSVSESMDPTFAAALYRYARDAHFVRDEDLRIAGIRKAFRR